MAEKTMNPMVKYLLIAIAFFAQILLVSGVSVFVYKSYTTKNDPAKQQTAGVNKEIVKAKYDFDEFKISTLDPGICQFKVELYLNDEDISKKIDEQISFIRDNIARIAMNFTIDEIKSDYRQGNFHNKIYEWLDKNIILKMGKKTSWYSEKEYSVIQVNITGFSAIKLE